MSTVTHFNPDSIYGFDSASTGAILTKGSSSSITFQSISAIVPSNVSSFTNDAGYINSGVTAMTYYATSADVVNRFNSLATVATSGRLSTLSDVTINNPSNGQVLTYSASSWVNSTIDISIAESMHWLDLYNLYINEDLKPNCLYRITDYQATTTQIGTTALNECAIDLIVYATSEKTLDCRALAVKHSDKDEYFDYGFDLTKWEIWYDIENNDNKYAWADTRGGSGVIYRMIDDFGNDCPYDFKNIAFSVDFDTKNECIANTYTGDIVNMYTFTSELFKGTKPIDASVMGFEHCHDNKIEQFINHFNLSHKMELPKNVFFGNGYLIAFNCVKFDSFNNFFDGWCVGNTIGNSCQDNFLYTSQYNKISNGCSNILLSNSLFNDFGQNCSNITLTDFSSYNKFAGNNSQIVLSASTTGSNSNYLQNIYVAQGASTYTATTIARNLSYRTTIAKLSDGTIRVYKEDEDDFNAITELSGSVNSLSANSSTYATKTYVDDSIMSIDDTIYISGTGFSDYTISITNDKLYNLIVSSNTRINAVLMFKETSGSPVVPMLCKSYQKSVTNNGDNVSITFDFISTLVENSSYTSLKKYTVHVTVGLEKIYVGNYDFIGYASIVSALVVIGEVGGIVPTPMFGSPGQLVAVSSAGTYELISVVNSENIPY